VTAPEGRAEGPRVETGPGWELRLGDCLCPTTGLASLADKSVDHVLSDPPYSRDLYSRTRTNKGSGKRPDGSLTCRSDRNRDEQISSMRLASLAIGAIDDILAPVAAQVTRVSSRWVVVFCDFEIAYRWQQEIPRYVRTGAWVKTDPMPQVTGDRPAAGFEPCVICHPSPGRMRWNGGGRPAVWIVGTTKGAERSGNGHPCPKPLALMEALVSDFTNPGELVCDPFAGSGTTGVACIRLGRRFIGWERDPKYFAVAVKRLRAAREQLRFELPTEPMGKQAPLLPFSPSTPRGEP
jgi:site-specific DNA-methyltransferase (adenine-specific)